MLTLCMHGVLDTSSAQLQHGRRRSCRWWWLVTSNLLFYMRLFQWTVGSFRSHSEDGGGEEHIFSQGRRKDVHTTFCRGWMDVLIQIRSRANPRHSRYSRLDLSPQALLRAAGRICRQLGQCEGDSLRFLRLDQSGPPSLPNRN